MAGDPPLPDSWSLVYNEEHEILMNRKGETPMPSSFAQFAIAPSLVERLHQTGKDIPTPVQERAIPALLQGRDVICRAQTGGEDPFLCRASFYKNYGSKDLRPGPHSFPDKGAGPADGR